MKQFRHLRSQSTDDIRQVSSTCEPGSGSSVPCESSDSYRWRRIFAVGATTMGAGGISRIANLLVLPFVARALEKGEFGLWLNLTTTFTLLSALDFGVGPAVMGQVSEARGRDAVCAVRRVVTTALALLSGVALLLLAISGILSLTLPWNDLLGVGHEVPATNVDLLVFAAGATAALSLPLGIANRVYYARQRGHVVALSTAFGVLAQAAGLVGVAALAPDLRWFSAVYLATSLLAGVTTTLLLARSVREFRPRLRDVDRSTCGRLGREGVQLFLLTVIGIVAYKSDAFVVGHYLGANRVAEYVLPFTVYAPVLTAAEGFLTPLWATYREAWARGDHAWVRRAFLRSVVLSAAVGVVAASVLALITPWLLRLWIGDGAVVPSRGLLVALGGYVVVMCVSAAVGVFLNGAGALRPQMIAGGLMAVLNVMASIWSVGHLGLAGPLWATVATQTLVVLVPCMLVARRRLTRPRAIARGMLRTVG
ncbi:lipopolysaccharide biosynthesis protein [Streptomyces sp. NPDC001848]|uniref:lipopolysaccharide biosynthesis protein n=1 Tax=Streptomyces sp. NPDC001848 TaxID=3364618 RepID=UPI00367F007C